MRNCMPIIMQVAAHVLAASACVIAFSSSAIVAAGNGFARISSLMSDLFHKAPNTVSGITASIVIISAVSLIPGVLFLCIGFVVALILSSVGIYMDIKGHSN